MVYGKGARGAGCVIMGLCALSMCVGGCDTRAGSRSTTRSQEPEPSVDVAGESGGSGTRAKGEEGSMGNPTPARQAPQASASATARDDRGAPVDLFGITGAEANGGGLQALHGYAVQAAAPAAGRAAPVDPKDATSFGMIGLLGAGGVALSAGGKGDPRAPAHAEAKRLDPNARYATTYRPGGAALAAFDSAVARGTIPRLTRTSSPTSEPATPRCSRDRPRGPSRSPWTPRGAP
jgi:hypothetical protein